MVFFQTMPLHDHCHVLTMSIFTKYLINIYYTYLETFFLLDFHPHTIDKIKEKELPFPSILQQSEKV